jgi:photosystem II stability/assembly factor-like uncharacterized protein
VGDQSTILESDDGGQTWNPRTNGVPTGLTLNGVFGATGGRRP